jgi:hypothetical protein
MEQCTRHKGLVPGQSSVYIHDSCQIIMLNPRGWWATKRFVEKLQTKE